MRLSVCQYLVSDTVESKIEFIRDVLSLDTDFEELSMEVIDAEVYRILEESNGSIYSMLELAVNSNPTGESTHYVGNTTYNDSWDFSYAICMGDITAISLAYGSRGI